VGGFLERGGYYKGKAKESKSSKVKQEQRQGKGIRIKTKASKGRKAHQGKGHLTSQGLWGGLQGTPRHPRVVVYCTRFTCICFMCCTFFFEAFYIYIYPKTGFPHGGFFRVMLTKNMCQFHAFLEV
jgi:hypothetical protein